MKKHIECPSCGGSQEVHNPGISMLVCAYCSSTLYWDKDAVLQAGEKSILPETDTRLFNAATGTLDGQRFEVIGHVRYNHPSGHWDEWYLSLADGGEAWLSEDERELFLERPVDAAQAEVPDAQQLKIDQGMRLDGRDYYVREINEAVCVGGWGQLPFVVLPGETYPYADIATRDGKFFGTLEYDRAGAPHCFLGQPLEHEQLTVEDSPEREQAAVSNPSHGTTIQCASCAAPLERPSEREVQTLVCGYCGAQNDLSGAEAQVMGMNPKRYPPGLEFEIGEHGHFHGADYEVCGRLYSKDDEGYKSRQYLLWNAERGYLYLEEEGGDYSLVQSTLEAPSANPFDLDEGERVKVGKKSYRFIEDGSTEVLYVDGAFPWRVACGNSSDYADFEAGNKVYSVERSAGEIEYFKGQQLHRYEVLQAFGKEDPSLKQAAEDERFRSDDSLKGGEALT